MEYNYGSIDVPGAQSTKATALNLLGEVVGYFTQSSGSFGTNTGFIDNQGAISAISPPGAVSSEAYGINIRNVVVGSYSTDRAAGAFIDDHGQFTTLLATGVAYDALDINTPGAVVGEYFVSTGFSSGFVYDHGTLTMIAEPGAHNTYASSINDFGEVAGYAPLPDGTTTYFVYNHGTFTNIPPPSGTVNVQDGSTGFINDLGQVVGSYTSDGERMGFIYKNGAYTTLSAPNATNTDATSINNLGQVIGTYSAGGTEHGYLYTAGHFTNIDVPGASTTTPVAINDLGQIAGSYTDNVGTHGFVASPDGGVVATLLSGLNGQITNINHIVSSL